MIPSSLGALRIPQHTIFQSSFFLYTLHYFLFVHRLLLNHDPKGLSENFQNFLYEIPSSLKLCSKNSSHFSFPVHQSLFLQLSKNNRLFWGSPTLSYGLETPGSKLRQHRASFICSLFLREHSPALSIVQRLKVVVSYILSGFLLFNLER